MILRALQILLKLFGWFLFGGALLNFSKHPHWLIRLWDFPRIMTAGLATAVGALYGGLFGARRPGDRALLAGLGFVVARQAYMIAPYTPVAPTRVKRSAKPPGPQSFRLLMSNVLMESREFDQWHAVVRDADPDVIVAVEIDENWDKALAPLAKRYPHVVKRVQDNYYGMVLYSRLPLEDVEVKFLVQDDVPSIHATVVLGDGQRVRLHALHPRPPEPVNDQDSAPRDAELVVMGRVVHEHERQEPTIVCGDLNDVAWSFTTQLFLRLSKLLDPRMGRGLYNSFDANSRVFRFPLDHVFHSDEFKLIDLRVLPHVGSDHFPMLIELSCEPEAARDAQPEPSERAEDQHKARGILDQQAEREQNGEEHGHVSETSRGGSRG